MLQTELGRSTRSALMRPTMLFRGPRGRYQALYVMAGAGPCFGQYRMSSMGIYRAPRGLGHSCG